MFSSNTYIFIFDLNIPDTIYHIYIISKESQFFLNTHNTLKKVRGLIQMYASDHHLVLYCKEV